MDLTFLVVGLGAALVYVATRYGARRGARPLPPPPDAATVLQTTSSNTPMPSRFTHDPMGVIRTSNPGRLLPRSPFVIVALVLVALVVLVNLPLL